MSLNFTMDCTVKFQKLCQIEARRLIFVVGIMAITHILCQSLILPYGNALLSLLPEAPIHGNYRKAAQQVFPDHEVPLHGNYEIAARSFSESLKIYISILVNASVLTSKSVRVVKISDSFNADEVIRHDSGSDSNAKEMDTKNEFESNNAFDMVENGNVKSGPESGEFVEPQEILALQIVGNQGNSSIFGKVDKTGHDFSLDQVGKPNFNISKEDASNADTGGVTTSSQPNSVASAMDSPVTHTTYVKHSTSNTTASISSASPDRFYVGRQAKVLPHHDNLVLLRSDLKSPKNDSAGLINGPTKKLRCDTPPKSITSIYEMNHRLVRHRVISRAMRPRWSSIRDREILAAKLQIENAPIAMNNGELYAPLFRNVSMFRRSYELMERILKVYIYKDGEKLIFHQPILKGLYASEGWFMKLMEGNKHFAVKDPRKAHLFYMPFSSRMLEYSLYVRNSHNRTNLRLHLKHYAEKIAAKYPFWNRTGGADHFLVACHDWAPYETRHHMEHCIKALCNADVTLGFKIGRDVSLAETYVRSARNPLRDLGGKPPSQRHVLAFFAGNMHGYLRPILLKHWNNPQDPNMKIFGPMPPGVASKMNYIQHMKSSKYCLCPKGYEVNSPRVVEAIFHECVPVIISDNFVPPFFEVLDWGAFSVLLAEKDVPNLKEILLSIPKERYLEMQVGVRKVQRHFLWHAKPMKYDLFHMTLHSIWYNRVFQIKPR